MSIRIGSSDIAAIVGVNPWRSPLQVFLEKTGKVPKPDQTPKMWLGTQMEPIILGMFELQTGQTLKRNSDVYEHEEFKWAVAVPDAFVIDGVQTIIEAKHKSWRARAEMQEGKAPDIDYLQVVWQMGVCNAVPQGRVVALIDKDLFWYDLILWDEGASRLFDDLIAAGKRFMEMVEANTPPSPEARDLAVVNRMIAPTAGKEIALPEAAGLLFPIWEDANTARKDYSKRAEKTAEAADKARAELVMMMGDAEIGRFGNWLIRRKTTTRRGYTVEPKEQTTVTIKNILAGGAGDE